MPELTPGELISLSSALVALVAVIVGPIVTWQIAKRQIHASVISANRQNWINDLRDSVADFMTSAKVAMVEGSLAAYRATEFAANEEAHNEAMRSMVTLHNKVTLLINPNESDHVKLINLMDEMIQHCARGGSDDIQRHDELRDAITKASQQILKREWERVKSGR